MMEQSTIKVIQDREMDDGMMIKLMHQDFKESDWREMGFRDP